LGRGATGGGGDATVGVVRRKKEETGTRVEGRKKSSEQGEVG